MRSFEYFTPTRVVFGKDTHLKVATLLKEQHCKKVLTTTADTVPLNPVLLMKSDPYLTRQELPM